MYIYLVLNQKKIFPLDWRATSATQHLTLTRSSQTYIDNPTTVIIYFLKKDSKPPVKFSKVSIKKKKYLSCHLVILLPDLQGRAINILKKEFKSKQELSQIKQKIKGTDKEIYEFLS